MATVICQGCGQAFELPPGHARNKVQCPGCGVICPVPEEVRAAGEKPAGPAWDDEPALLLEVPEEAPLVEPEPVLMAEAVQPAPSALPVEPEAPPRPRGELLFTCRRCGIRIRRQRECPVCGVQDDSPLPAEPAEAPKPPAEAPLVDAPLPVEPLPVGLAPHSLELDEGQPLGLAAEEDEEEAPPYELVDRDLPRCPRCYKDMPVGGVLCASCGFNLRTRKKVTRTYEPISRSWDTDMSLTTRLICLGGFQGFHLFLTLCAAVGGFATPFLVAWVPLTLIVCFVVGTYDHIDLRRDTRGRVTIERRWRFCFIPLQPEVTEVRGFEGVVCGGWNDAGGLEWAILISLLCLGLLPALIWWYLAIYLNHYHVSLARDHGHAEVTVYRGRSEEQMHEIARAVCNATGLRVLG